MRRFTNEMQSWNVNLYETKHSFVTHYGEDLLPLLNAQKGERILDLGCGSGDLTYKIAASGAELIGVDSSEEMILKAQEKYPDIAFLVKDGQDFKFTEPFDAVFSNAALHWMTQTPKKVATNIWRCLKSNGRFVFEMGGKGNVRQVLHALALAAGEFGVTQTELINYYPSLGQYATLLEAVGFRVIYATHFDRPVKLDGVDGLRNWVRMFRTTVFNEIPVARQKEFFQKFEAIARPTLYHDNSWWADYVRLRAVAIKTGNGSSLDI